MPETFGREAVRGQETRAQQVGDAGSAAYESATEAERVVRVRLVQSFFRAAVLTSYESKCALTGIAVPELLVASHIIPWTADESRRADPRNGLCLNALHDRAFDRGLIGFDEDLRVILSPRLRVAVVPPLHQTLLDLERREALRYHREQVFQR